MKKRQTAAAKESSGGPAAKPATTSATASASSEKKRKPTEDNSSAKKKSKPSEKHVEKKEKSEEKKPAASKKVDERNGSKAVEKKPKKETTDEKRAPSRDVAEENIFGLERMDKHNLVSAVLRRWKYCLDPWPGQLPPQPPHGYIEAHVPGLYVGVSNIHLGQLKDLRPFVNGKTPSMASLLAYKTSDLQQLLIKGINAQLSLLGNSPEDEKLKTKLRHELEKAHKLKVKKYERKYREALQAIGKPLPEYLTLAGVPAAEKNGAEENDDNDD